MTSRVYAAWSTALAVASVALFATLGEGHAMTVYVSVQGDDAWAGALPDPQPDGTDGPFRTLERARDALRTRAPGQPGEVVLRQGTYYLERPLALGPEDSGVEASPVVWRAQEGERVVLSGGRPLRGWVRRADGLWVAPLPLLAGKAWDFRQMRVADTMATLARYPDRDAADPLKKGWLFARSPDDGKAPWRTSMARIHTPGDWMAWDVDIPAAGDYDVWVCYGQLMKPFGRDDMGGQTVFQVDGGLDVPLMNLPDTGAWSTFAWSRCARLAVTAGSHQIRWTNRKGGGINFNAFALCRDPTWQPDAVPPALPAAQGQLLMVQAQDYVAAEGREMGVDQTAYVGKPDELPYGAGDIPEGDISGGQIQLFPAWGWVGGPVQIGDIDRDSHVLRLTGPNASQEVRIGNRYVIENVKWALDTPGEFFADTASAEVLYYPLKPGGDLPEIVAPCLDRIIDMRGDPESGRFVTDIRFEGLAFRDARYSIAVDSLYTPDDAAIHIRQGQRITMDDCDFACLGGYAVHLSERAAYCRVLRCSMRDMGQGGVIARGDNATQPTDCTVAGCRMQDLGQVYKHVAGVYVTTGARFRVAHNTIHDVPRYAISFKSYNADQASHECIAEYNDIRRTNLETNDTGAIETLGRDRQPTGNVIRYNLILDTVGMKHTAQGELLSPYYTWGIYLDDFSSGTTVFGNIVARNVRGGYHNHLGFDNVVENNIFVEGKDYQVEWNGGAEMRRNTFCRNIVVYADPKAVYMRSGGWDPAVLKECDNNVIWWTGGDLAGSDAGVTPAGSWQAWRDLGFEAHSVIADPCFVDPHHDDYRLAADSPALRLSFQPIPVDRIGADAYDPGSE